MLIQKCQWNWNNPYTHISTCFSRTIWRKSENEWKTYEYAEHIWCDYWIFPVPVSPATDHNLHKLCHVTKASCRADDRFKLQKKNAIQIRCTKVSTLIHILPVIWMTITLQCMYISYLWKDSLSLSRHSNIINSESH